MKNGGHGKWALLVGIDRYPGFGSEVQLEGCVNDVQILRDALIRRFGFTEERMTVLLNERATRDGILDAMEDLVRKVGEDDVVVFHYSGHGSQKREPEGEEDEPDGWDETLVPFDSGRFPRQNRDITDDEIYGWLLRLTARTPHVTLIIDSCHSGTVVRKDFGGKVRWVCGEKPSHDSPGQPVLRGASTEGPSGWLPLGGKYVLLAACASMETASEIPVGEPEPVRHGALTYLVVQELMSPSFTGGTYRELFERLSPRVKALSLSQNPQLEGDRDREVFGVQRIHPMPFLSVRSREGDKVVLDAGGACGLTVGSEWEIYEPGTRSVQDDAGKIGEVIVTAVRATFSEARILKEGKDLRIEAGARAVETVRCLKAARLKVEIVARADRRRELVDFLLSSSLVVEARPGEPADARISLEDWTAILADGTHLWGPALHRDQSETWKMLRENLENAARLRGIAELRNPASLLHGLVDLMLYRLEGGQCLPPESDENGDPVFTEGDRVVLEVRNRSDKEVYIYLLDIGLTGKVVLVYPAEGSHEVLEAGFTAYVGKREGDERTLFIPEDFELPHSRGGGGRLQGRETVKLFATTSPAHFDLLYHSGRRFRGMARSLNDFLRVTFDAGGQGAYRTAEEDWTTVERSFLLRARGPK